MAYTHFTNLAYTTNLAVGSKGSETALFDSGGTLTIPAGANITCEDATNSGAVFVSKNTLAYTDTTAKDLFVLPAHADVIDVVIVVTTAFDDSGTDLIVVGTASDDDKYIDDYDASSAGIARAGSGATMPYGCLGDVGASALTIKGKYTGQNGDASAGAATVYMYWTMA